LGGGFLKNYILRIYCQKKDNPRRFVGIVEEPERRDKKAFTNLDDLWKILNHDLVKDTERNHKSSKISPKGIRHMRRDIVFFTGYSTHSSSGEIISNGVIANISKSGMCLLTPQALSKGEEILIKCSTNSPARRAVVRWSKRYKDCHCRTGLEFVN
jgi:hypothetical protein